MVDIVQRAVRLCRQRKAVTERRSVKVGRDLADDLRFNGDHKLAVAGHKAALIFQDDLRLGNPFGEKGIGIGHHACDDLRPILLGESPGGLRRGDLRGSLSRH